MKNTVQVIISQSELHARINELGKEISKRYQDSSNKMVLVGLLRGSFIFVADLCRAINIEHKIDFMIVSSYGNNVVSSKKIKILKDLDENIYQKNVLIVEDIVDSGFTLSRVLKVLKLRQPKSVAICVLLDKYECREVKIHVDYVGFPIHNDFMVGYGIDCAQSYRHLPYIGKVIKSK
ncbi:MAG: hypoxanthine phosphoribosyltransferase [Buchnera aphidicola (Floraphis choui)]